MAINKGTQYITDPNTIPVDTSTGTSQPLNEALDDRILYAIPESYGAVGDGETDDTQAVKDALASGKSVELSKTYRVKVSASTGSLVSTAQTSVFGKGALLGENTDLSGQLPVLVLSEGSSCEGITISAYATNATYTDNTSYTNIDSDPEATFNYDQYLIGLEFGDNSSAYDVTAKNLWRGFSSSSKNNIITRGCTLYQNGVWHTQYYDCDGVVFNSNTVIYGGDAGGVAFSSTKNLTVSGNFVKTVGTGINTGGSSAVGFNVENVSITGNTVIARDAINLENGAVNYTVTGNNIQIIKNYDLAGTNGVGIGNTSGSSGSFQGLIGNGVISSNEISSYDVPYSYGIRVGTFETNTEILERFIITDNKASGCNIGLFLHNENGSSKLRNAKVTGNNFNTGSRAIRLSNVEKAICSNNIIISGSSTTISNYYGITLDDYDDITCNNNIISGYGYAFDLTSDGTNVSRCVLLLNSILPNEQDQSAPLGALNLDANFSTTSYYYSGRDVISSTDSRLTLRSRFVEYSPGSSTSINLLGNVSYPEGETITVQFDGNVTLQNNPPFIVLKGGTSTVPPSGETITFIVYSSDRVKEITRSY